MTVVTQFVAAIGASGSGNNQFTHPEAICTDGTYLFITEEFTNHRIQKRLASDLSFVAKIGSQGSGNDQFNSPRGICQDGTFLYVADADNNRIMKRMMSDLSYVSKIGSNGSGNDQFTFPMEICTDGTYVWVVDSWNHRIVKRLCSDLSYVSQIGTMGSGNDQFIYPRGIGTDGTYLYVGDTGNARVVKRLCTDLSYVSQSGSVGYGDLNFGTTTAFDSAPICIGVGGGYVAASDPGNSFFLPNQNDRVVIRNASDLSYATEMGWGDGGFFLVPTTSWRLTAPHGNCISGGYIYTCDHDNNRITKRSISTASAPANDNLASRVTVTPGGGPYAGTTLAASQESGEIGAFFDPHKPFTRRDTVWYQLTAPNDGNPHLYLIDAQTTPAGDITQSNAYIWVTKCINCPPTVPADLYQLEADASGHVLYGPERPLTIPPAFSVQASYMYVTLHPNETVYFTFATTPGNGVAYALNVTEESIPAFGRQIVAGADLVTSGSPTYFGDVGNPDQSYIDQNINIQFYRLEGIPGQPFTTTIVGVPGSDHGGNPEPAVDLYWQTVATAVRITGLPDDELEFIDTAGGDETTISAPDGNSQLSQWTLGPDGVAYLVVNCSFGDDQGQFNGTVDFETGPVYTLAATQISDTQATLHAIGNANGINSKIYFNYGPTPSLGQQTTPVVIGSAVAYVAVATTIYGLTAGTTFYFEAVMEPV